MFALKLLFICVGCILNCCDETEGANYDNLHRTNRSSNLTICERRQHKISNLSPTAGYIGASVAILMFGSNFVPVKKITTGDGVFFQWIVCLGIWILGLFVHLYNGDERKFFPLVMVGGAIWCTGNMCVVPVIKTIGLAMGLLIWGTLNLIAGWATGRFGTFGLICEQPVQHSAMNYIGVMLAMISLGMFIFIKSEDPTENIASANTSFSNSRGDNNLVQDDDDEENVYLLAGVKQDSDSSWVDHFSKNQKRFIGIFLSVVSGILYGISFVPVYIIQKNNEDAPDDGIQYAFSQFSGTLLASTVYFLIYCLYKRNKPDIYSEAVAPGFLSGILWAVGDVGWFVANTYLSESVSFPIVTTGPGIIASIWGIFVFREITGWKNFLLLGVAMCFAVSGSVVTGFSK
ncbi:transmembrane protein 144-like [Dendronephthya gigantea]|uniref:transmembrane protein 144-like n=1 Tax=Dendronephthya gigantea TaxID=151771 RepID=UPI00106CB91E|nr:transmembrane protein 144-like [Dendronephthya gigantea]